MTRLPALDFIVIHIFHPFGFVSLGNANTCVFVHVRVCEYGRMHAKVEVRGQLGGVLVLSFHLMRESLLFAAENARTVTPKLAGFLSPPPIAR